jgi:tetratricopeptide (TPR) repeat protein
MRSVRCLSSGQWPSIVVVTVIVALSMTACAPKVPPPVVPGAPRFPDFVYPLVPTRLGDERLHAIHDTAWRLLQSGDVRGAVREYGEAVKRSPGYYPAEAGLAYALVADTKHKEALAHFDRVLQQVPAYAAALAGRGEALVATGQVDLAITSFEAARRADPALADLGRRIDALRFGRVDELVASASRAANAGRLDEARRAYESAIGTSPDSAFLYRDLGHVELRADAVEAAVAHLSRAVELDPDDVKAWIWLGDAHEHGGRLDEAVRAIERAIALDPSEANRRALEKRQGQWELSRLPVEYRAIPDASAVTRGELAALMGVRIVPLLPSPRRNTGVVVTDARSHWAATWILTVTRAGFMDVYPNHTFQPRVVVKRADLAAAVSRVLALLPAGAFRPARPVVADVATDHLSYPAVAAAIASGVMPAEDGSYFRPARAVTGDEAVAIIGRLEDLAKRARRDASPRA